MNPFSAFFAALRAATASLNDFAAGVNNAVAMMRDPLDDELIDAPPALPEPHANGRRIGAKVGGK